MLLIPIVLAFATHAGLLIGGVWSTVHILLDTVDSTPFTVGSINATPFTVGSIDATPFTSGSINPPPFTCCWRHGRRDALTMLP